MRVYYPITTSIEKAYFKLVGAIIYDCLKFPPAQIKNFNNLYSYERVKEILNERIKFAEQNKMIELYSDICDIDESRIKNCIIKKNKNWLKKYENIK